MSNSEITKAFNDLKVCFVSNSFCMPGMLFNYSYKTYSNIISNNFMLIPGVINGENGFKKLYGIDAFIYMLNTLKCISNYIDYIIYIDEDCFINNLTLLYKEFLKFKDSEAVIGGVSDGRMICHRTFNPVMVNTFLSFWNYKKLKELDFDINTISNYSINDVKDKVPEVYNKCYELQDNIYNNSKRIKKLFGWDDIHFPPYCEEMKKYDPKLDLYGIQPYTCDYNDNIRNDMYYKLEQYILVQTKMPFYYFNVMDDWSPNISNDENNDVSGITSRVMDDNGNIIAYHTWFARGYYTYYNENSFDRNFFDYHVNRINKLLKKLNLID